MGYSFPVYYPERAESLYGLSIALTILTTLFLLLRFWSRLLLREDKFKADDWTALAAWPFVVGTSICGALAMRHGFGTHFSNILAHDPNAVPSILIITYVGELTWVYGIGIIRSSAILFYHRIFGSANSGFRKWVIIGIVANVLFSLILGFVCIFQCDPVRGYWDKSLTGAKCLSTQKIELGSGISSILLDVYTLVLPMPSIWKLQMRLGKKVLTVGTFVLAYCVIVCTIGRTVAVVQTGTKITEDVTWYFPDILYWVIIELSIAHICISLPSLFVLCRRGKRYGWSSLFTSKDVESKFSAHGRGGIYRSDDVHLSSKERSLGGTGYGASVSVSADRGRSAGSDEELVGGRYGRV